MSSEEYETTNLAEAQVSRPDVVDIQNKNVSLTQYIADNMPYCLVFLGHKKVVSRSESIALNV